MPRQKGVLFFVVGRRRQIHSLTSRAKIEDSIVAKDFPQNVVHLNPSSR